MTNAHEHLFRKLKKKSQEELVALLELPDRYCGKDRACHRHDYLPVDAPATSPVNESSILYRFRYVYKKLVEEESRARAREFCAGETASSAALSRFLRWSVPLCGRSRPYITALFLQFS